MNNLPGANEMIGLLDSLRSTVRDFAAREEKLNSDYRIQSGAELRAFEEASKEQETVVTARLAEAEAKFQTEMQRWQSRFAERKVRINRAHNATRKHLVDDINRQDGQRKYKIQESSLEAERRRDSGLAAAASTLEQFRHALAESVEGYRQLGVTTVGVFSGSGKFRKLLAADHAWPEPDLSADAGGLLEQIRRLHDQTRQALEAFRKRFLPRLFRYFPVWLDTLVLGAFAVAVPVLRHFDVTVIPLPYAGAALGVLAAILGIYLYGIRRALPAASSIAGNLAKGLRLLDACSQKAEQRFVEEQERIKREFAETSARLNQRWREAVKWGVDMRSSRPMEIDEKAARIHQRNDRFRAARLERLERDHAHTLAGSQQEAEARARQLAAAHEERAAELGRQHEARWTVLTADWRSQVEPVCETFRAANAAAGQLFPPWEISLWESWTPPRDFRNAAKFAGLQVDLAKFVEVLPKDPRLALPGKATLSIPLLLTYPSQGSLLLETSKGGGDEAIGAINNVIFRLLSATPPGKLSFTIFDPVGLGQNFAGLMHLADYEESHINSRIWTQTNQIEEKLSELNEHMEKVIQMYLRNEYATIAEYNAQAGSIAEKYHVLVVASFPVNFSETAAARLRNIATSGARCGVYTLIHWDRRQPLPPEFVPDELRKNSLHLLRTEHGFGFARWREPGTRLQLDPPPSPEFATHFLHQVGQSGKDSNRVEVPFEQVAPSETEVWTEETADQLRVAIGRSGATRLQCLEIGSGTRQHALIAGKTGSGKSTLFHVLITNLALWCSPEQVEFYLVDFKKGVEFKCYANRRLPHARVVAIESDRQFGLSVLERVDAELRRRGDIFRKLGVQDLPGYKRAGGTEPMPRSLLIIDEFQEFFVEEDRVSNGAAVLLDRIVRQGRAFGIHVLLGSQTLGGAYTLARATLGQMVIRIALQCNEADAYLIMDQDNPAPRLLSRPGEGIYNDAAGSIEGNSPFQAVWLPEDVRDRYLTAIRARADGSANEYPGPFVFEGNAPADVRENGVLNELLETEPLKAPVRARIWMGSPNSIKGPTEAGFQRQSGNNLLMVGQSEERAASILAVALVSLAAQYPKGAVRFVLLDSTPPGFPQHQLLERVVGAVPHEIVQVNTGNLAEIMAGLGEELEKRTAQHSIGAPETFVLVHGLQDFKKLRQEDEFGFSSTPGESAQPSAVFLNLINEGPAHGIHLLVSCDTFNNVGRFLGRKPLSEFEMRVLFQMSATDSASLVDSPDAATLGLHRALYYNDREGYMEIFRPYALPGNDWIEEVSKSLRRISRQDSGTLTESGNPGAGLKT